MAEISPELTRKIQDLQGRYEQNPGRFFVALANAYRDAGDVEAAEQIVRENLKRHSGPLSAHVVLGRCLADRGAFEEADSEFRYVLSIDPQNLIALRTLGEMAVRGGRLDDAERWYGELLSVDPMNQEAREALERLGTDGGVPSDGTGSASDFGADVDSDRDDVDAPAGFAGADAESDDAAFDYGSIDLGADVGPGVETDVASPSALDDMGGWGEITLDDAPATESGPADELDADDDEGGERMLSFDDAELTADAEAADEAGEIGAGASAELSSDDDLGFEPPRGFGDADDLASDEGDDDAAPVTDTMAELYARQGLLARAAETYRELIRRRGETPERARRLAELEARVDAEGPEVRAAADEPEAPRPESRLPGVEDLPVLETGLVGDAAFGGEETAEDSGDGDVSADSYDAGSFGELTLDDEPGAPGEEPFAASPAEPPAGWEGEDAGTGWEDEDADVVDVAAAGDSSWLDDVDAAAAPDASGGWEDEETDAEAPEPVGADVSAEGWDRVDAEEAAPAASVSSSTGDAFADSFAYGFEGAPAAGDGDDPALAAAVVDTAPAADEAPLPVEAAPPPLPVEAAEPALPVESREPTPPVRTFGGYLSSLLTWRPGAGGGTAPESAAASVGVGPDAAEPAVEEPAPFAGDADDGLVGHPVDVAPEAHAGGGTVEYEPETVETRGTAEESADAADEADDEGMDALPWLAGPDEVAGEESDTSVTDAMEAAETTREAGDGFVDWDADDEATAEETDGAAEVELGEPMPWEVGVDLPDVGPGGAVAEDEPGTAPAEEPAAAEPAHAGDPEAMPWELPSDEPDESASASAAGTAEEPSAGFSFDDFFAGGPPSGETPAGEAAEPEPPLPAPPAPPAAPEPSAAASAPAGDEGAADGEAGATGEDDEDLESFQAWLRSLKR